MSKHANGDGSIKKLPSGSWRGQIMDGFREDGKKNVLSFTAPTKAEVKEKIRKYLSDKEAGLYSATRKHPSTSGRTPGTRTTARRCSPRPIPTISIR